MLPPPPRSTLFPYTTLFRSQQKEMEKQLKAMQQKQAVESARGLIAKAREINGVRAIIENLGPADGEDRKSTRLNSSHTVISYAVFCLKKKKKKKKIYKRKRE